MAAFEQDLAKLEEIVDRLERGDLTLEESVRLFEDGSRLAQSCKIELEQAEGRVQVLIEGKNGSVQLMPMDFSIAPSIEDEDEED